MSYNDKQFNLSPETIQGRLRISFLTTVFLMLLVLALAFFGLLGLLLKEYYIDRQISAVKYYSTVLGNAINQSYVDVISYSIYEQPHYREAAIKTMREEIVPAFDTLQSLEEQLDDVYTRNGIMEVEDLYFKLRDSYNLLGSIEPKELETFVKTRISPLVGKLNHEIRGLSGIQTKKEQLMAESQKEALNMLYTALGTLTLVFLLLSYFISNRIIRATLDSLEIVNQYTRSLAAGDLPANIDQSKDELNSVFVNLQHLTDNLSRMRAFAYEVGKGNFDTDIVVFNNSGMLGVALGQMRKSLKEISEEERVRGWLNAGIAKMGQIIREKNEEIYELCDNLLANMINYTESNQGAIFVLNEHGVLEMTAGYAYGRKKFITKEIEVGHGLLGEAFRDGDIKYITDIPRDYMEISSGLGKGTPGCLVIVPLKSQTETLGVMEIASFEMYKEHHISFFERVAAILASSITTIITNQKTRLLLAEAQEYSLRMNAQEEVLKQHAEELMAMREDLERRYTELSYEAGLLKSTIDNSVAAMLHIEANGKISFSNEAACLLFGYHQKELQTKNIFRLIPSVKEELEKLVQLEKIKSVSQHSLVPANNYAVNVYAALSRFNYEGKKIFSLALLPVEQYTEAGSKTEK